MSAYVYKQKDHCDVCGCSHFVEDLTRSGFLYLRGSEGGYLCNRCVAEIYNFIHSLQNVAQKVRSWNDGECK
jgi:hypothetical protein